MAEKRNESNEMNDLPELLDHYFSLGVAEGNEGRDHDTNDGDAQATRDLIDQKIQRLQRELEEAKEFRAILEGHLAAAIDDYNEARKAAFIEVEQKAREWAEHYPQSSDGRNTFVLFAEWAEGQASSAKAEETRT